MQVAETFAFQLPPPALATDAEVSEAAYQPLLKRARSGDPQEGSTDVRHRAVDVERGKAVTGGAQEEGVAQCRLLPPTLMDVACLDTCVTVVDAFRFYDDLQSIEELKDR